MNPAREALSRAVNRAIANGAPVYIEQLPADELLRRADLALGFAGMVGDTPHGRELAARGRAMQAAAFDKHLGPIPAADAALTDEELLAALSD